MREFTTAAQAEAFRRKFGGALIERDGAYFVDLQGQGDEAAESAPSEPACEPFEEAPNSRHGKAGGAARAKAISSERRREIARMGGLAKAAKGERVGGTRARRVVVTFRLSPEERDLFRAAIEKHDGVSDYRELFLRAVAALDQVDQFSEPPEKVVHPEPPERRHVVDWLSGHLAGESMASEVQRILDLADAEGRELVGAWQQADDSVIIVTRRRP